MIVHHKAEVSEKVVDEHFSVSAHVILPRDENESVNGFAPPFCRAEVKELAIDIATLKGAQNRLGVMDILDLASRYQHEAITSLGMPRYRHGVRKPMTLQIVAPWSVRAAHENLASFFVHSKTFETLCVHAEGSLTAGVVNTLLEAARVRKEILKTWGTNVLGPGKAPQRTMAEGKMTDFLKFHSAGVRVTTTGESMDRSL